MSNNVSLGKYYKLYSQQEIRQSQYPYVHNNKLTELVFFFI